MKAPLLIAIGLAAILLIGCGKSEQSSQTSTPPTPAADDAAAVAATNQQDSVGQALEKYGKTMATAKKNTLIKVDTITVDRAVQAFHADRGQNPATLDELVKEGFLPRLPELPSGMKYSYNADTGEVKVVPVN